MDPHCDNSLQSPNTGKQNHGKKCRSCTTPCSENRKHTLQCNTMYIQLILPCHSEQRCLEQRESFFALVPLTFYYEKVSKISHYHSTVAISWDMIFLLSQRVVKHIFKQCLRRQKSVPRQFRSNLSTQNVPSTYKPQSLYFVEVENIAVTVFITKQPAISKITKFFLTKKLFSYN